MEFMDRKLNIALIGCGIWGKNILRDLLSLGVDTTVIDVNDNLKDEITGIGAKSFYSKIPEFNQYDAVVISTPAITHRNVLEQLIEFENPVYIEKPLCTTMDDLEWIKSSYSGKNIFLMHVWRYHNGIIELGNIAKNNMLGKPVRLITKRTNWTSPRQDVDTIWTLLPHDLTIAIEVLGFIPEPVSATCEIYGNKARGMTGFMGSVPGFSFEVSNRYFDKRREVRLHCENGVAVLKDGLTDHVELYHGDDYSYPEDVKTENIFFDNTPPLKKEINVFIDYINGGKKPKSSLEEGINVVEKIIELRQLANIE